jgi:N utilization substance protein A
VLEVRKSTKGPAIVLSRTHEGFIRGLFHLEVPEIAEDIVQIKGIAREAGDRTKIAVWSKDEKVDCVGACVGMRGTRVKNIVRELHGEKIDIIRWHESVKEFIAAALSPAKISEIQADDEAKQALVIVDDDQLSLAIGKKGQNVRLASKLTGWQLDIKTRAQLAAPEAALRSLSGVGPAMEKRLREAGIETVAALAAIPLEQLTAVEGIGEKTAQRLIESAQAAMAAAQDAAAAPPEAAPGAPEAPAAEPPATDPEPPAAEGTEESQS